MARRDKVLLQAIKNVNQINGLAFTFCGRVKDECIKEPIVDTFFV